MEERSIQLHKKNEHRVRLKAGCAPAPLRRSTGRLWECFFLFVVSPRQAGHTSRMSLDRAGEECSSWKIPQFVLEHWGRQRRVLQPAIRPERLKASRGSEVPSAFG